jgi:hypothetical protein
MAGFILFDATRGLALGWLGAIVAVALAPAFALLVAAVEFAILNPMIARLMAEQAAGTFENSSVMPIGLVSIVFVIAIFFALRAVGQMTRGLVQARLSNATTVTTSEVSVRHPEDRAGAAPVLIAAPTPRVARALESISRRDGTTPAPGAGRAAAVSLRASSVARDASSAPVAAATSRDTAILPFNRRSPQLRSVSRRSRASARRDA